MDPTNPTPYSVERRPIKFPRIEFKTGELQLILPYNQNEHEFYLKHLDWIRKREHAIDSALKNAEGKTLCQRNQEIFKSIAKQSVLKNQSSLKTNVNKIFFKEMKSKWASYSSNKNVTINLLMSYLPDDLIDYILYHEMAHGIQKRHDEKFWKIIQKRYPDHQQFENELFSYWFLIQNLTTGEKP